MKLGPDPLAVMVQKHREVLKSNSYKLVM